VRAWFSPEVARPPSPDPCGHFAAAVFLHRGGVTIMTWVPAFPASSDVFMFAVTLGVAATLLIAAIVVLLIIDREQKKHY
jgi:hypothetical protein